MLSALTIIAASLLQQVPEKPPPVRIQLSAPEVDLRDPALDGWSTEEFAQDLTAALYPLKHALESGAAPDADLFRKIQRPHESTREVVQQGSFVTECRCVLQGGSEELQDGSLLEFIGSMRQPLGSTHAHAKIKVIGVSPPEDGSAIWFAELMIEVGGCTDSLGFDAIAKATIKASRDGEELFLDELIVHDIESTKLEIPNGRLFEDVTASLLAGEPCWKEQLLIGHDRWAQCIEERLGMGLYKHSGIAIGDLSGDGLEDIYLPQPAGLPNLLLIRRPDGTLFDAAKSAGVDWMDHSTSAVIVDLDGDGDKDLALTVGGTVLLHECVEIKNGEPRLQLRASLASRDNDLYGLSAADADLDGDVDLYVTADFANKVRGSDGEAVEVARFDYVDANDGGRNVLWRNGGTWRFEDATAELGLDVHNSRHSLAATWRDVDEDGDLDLYVANDYGKNCFYLNKMDPTSDARHDGPVFVECATEWGLTDRGSGMSIDIGDPNRDGRLDFLVANMWSSAGRRVVPQAAFGAAGTEAERDQVSRFAKGNTLFVAGEPGRFVEASRAKNIERGRWAWGTPFVDIDGDGWEDMLVGNGYVTSHDPGDL